MVGSSRRRRRYKLGFGELLAFALGGVIGSGWVLGMDQAWRIAGRAAVWSWLIGGLAMLVIGLVLVQLGKVLPMDGGLVWWPFYSSGPAVATVVAAAVWIFYGLNPPSEAVAMVKTLGHWSPALYDAGVDRLTWPGVGLAAIFVVLLIGSSLFALRVIARFTVVASVVKVAVPLIVLALLIRSGFDAARSPDPASAGHGFGSVLTAITSGGIIYAYIGFQAPLDFAGHAKNPRRSIPPAVIIPIAFALVLYSALQWLSIRAGVWHGVDYSSPYTRLAAGLAVNHVWITGLIQADEFVSPAGSAVVFASALARDVDELGRNHLVPRQVGSLWRISPWRGRRLEIPLIALTVSLVIGLFFLLLLRDWASIVSASGVMTVFVYAVPAVSYAALNRHDPEQVGLTGVRRILPPASFVVMTLILYWAHFRVLALGIVLGAAGTALLFVLRSRDQSRWSSGAVPGLWLGGYFAGLLVLAGLRTHGWPGSPVYASLGAVALGVIAYRGLVGSSVAYLQSHPPEFEKHD